MTQQDHVDIALVVAMDCSSSASDKQVSLQMQGLGQAFLREELWTAIQSGRFKQIAICVVQWSGKDNQVIAIPWAVISNAEDATVFATTVVTKARLLEPTATSISSALQFVEKLFATAPRASRQVIDISVQGPNNVGPSLQPIRDQLLQKGITINGLAISNEWRNLSVYLENEVAGGNGHFVVKVLNYSEYADTLYRKLFREITNLDIS